MGNAPDGYGFCAVCGGLYKLDDGKLPPHAWVGRGSIECPGKKIVYEGQVST